MTVGFCSSAWQSASTLVLCYNLCLLSPLWILFLWFFSFRFLPNMLSIVLQVY
jgi:hypothetical protein